MSHRYDSIRIERYERTPSGGLIIPAIIARTGVLEYRTDSGPVREYRSPEEVFAKESLDTIAHAPVIDGHPKSDDKFVNPSTYGKLAKGYIGEKVEITEKYIKANVIITDAEMIRMIDNGKRKEISPGYKVKEDLTSGTSPEGEVYDQRQTKIRYNHFGLFPVGKGRAGPEVSLRLDSNGDQVREVTLMKQQIVIDGITYEYEADNGALKQILERELSRKDKIEGRFDALCEELKTTKELLEKAVDPKAISTRIQARIALEKRAKELDKTIRCDGLSDLEVMVKVLGKDFVSEGRSDEYIRAFFDAQKVRLDGIDRVRVVADEAQKLPEASNIDKLYEEDKKTKQNLWLSRMEGGLK